MDYNAFPRIVPVWIRASIDAFSPHGLNYWWSLTSPLAVWRISRKDKHGFCNSLIAVKNPSENHEPLCLVGGTERLYQPCTYIFVKAQRLIVIAFTCFWKGRPLRSSQYLCYHTGIYLRSVVDLPERKITDVAWSIADMWRWFVYKGCQCIFARQALTRYHQATFSTLQWRPTLKRRWL